MRICRPWRAARCRLASRAPTSRGESLEGPHAALHRQQELLVLVDAPVGADEAGRHRRSRRCWLRFDGFEAESPFSTELAQRSARPAACRCWSTTAWRSGTRWRSPSTWPRSFPAAQLWPRRPQLRAHAHAASCAEMHAGFGALRNHFPMNIEASLPRDRRAAAARACRGARRHRAHRRRCGPGCSRATAARCCSAASRIADAFFAPVVMRLRHLCACRCAAPVSAYMERVLALPGVAAWIADALAEQTSSPSTSRTARTGERRAPGPAAAPTLQRMKIYSVGGAVRDALLGLPAATATGSSSARRRTSMLDGRLPCRSARTSRSSCTRRPTRNTRWRAPSARPRPATTASQFHAAPDVTLEDDLARRDLTINAIAQDDARHAHRPIRRPARPGGAACCATSRRRFAEDPVRILRLARFAARFADFSVAPETLALMRAMVDAGEVDALVPERVWQELSRGLMEARPSRMFEVLRGCGALARLLPEVDRLWGVPQPRRAPPRDRHRRAPDAGAATWRARWQATLPVRFACLVHDLGKGTTPADAVAAPHRPRAAQRRAARALWPSACACRRTAANWPRWWRANTATCTAAANSAPPRWCACSSAATPCAGPSASPRCCSPANATRAAASACRTGPTRSARGCCAGAGARAGGRRHGRGRRGHGARADRPGDRAGGARGTRGGRRRGSFDTGRLSGALCATMRPRARCRRPSGEVS